MELIEIVVSILSIVATLLSIAAIRVSVSIKKKFDNSVTKPVTNQTIQGNNNSQVSKSSRDHYA